METLKRKEMIIGYCFVLGKHLTYQISFIKATAESGLEGEA